MNAEDMMDDLYSRAPSEGIAREFMSHCTILLTYMHARVLELQLDDGHHLTNVVDFQSFVKKCADRAQMLRSENPPRLLKSRFDDTCHNCGHVHREDHECGQPIGGGRICRCENAVTA